MTTNTETTATLMIVAARVADAINACGRCTARADGRGGYVRVVACQTGVRFFGPRDSGLDCIVDVLRASSDVTRNLVKVSGFAHQTYRCAEFETRMAALVRHHLDRGKLAADGTDWVIA